jgi:hypothetical protein
VGVWSHDGRHYEVNSYYSLPDDAWRYEVVVPAGANGAGPHLAVLVPDATPQGEPFTPKGDSHVVVRVGGGELPWPIVRRLLHLIQSSGDLVPEAGVPDRAPDELRSHHVWSWEAKQFEVNSFHFGEHDSWCYGLYEVDPGAEGNDDIEVRIPDANPAGGPFVPGPADRVRFTAHGDWAIPWPIFRRFVDAIEASGDLGPDETAAGRNCDG